MANDHTLFSLIPAALRPRALAVVASQDRLDASAIDWTSTFSVDGGLTHSLLGSQLPVSSADLDFALLAQLWSAILGPPDEESGEVDETDGATKAVRLSGSGLPIAVICVHETKLSDGSWVVVHDREALLSGLNITRYSAIPPI